MPFITSNTTTSTTVSNNSGFYTLLSGVSHTTSLSTLTVNTTDSANVSVQVLGQMASSHDRTINAFFAQDRLDVLVSQTGAVLSGFEAIRIGSSSAESHVSNAGIISGTSGIVSTGEDTTVVNSGSILATSRDGIQLASGSGIINNSGTISSAGTGLNLFGSADFASSRSFDITNSGTITGTDTAITIEGTGAPILTNSGTITSNDVAFTSEDVSGRVVFYNSGTITGDVKFGASSSIFDGRDGLVLGEISGGASSDTIYSGYGDDVIRTGAGSDSVFAGAGDDIVYAGLSDRSDGGDGTDTLVLDASAYYFSLGSGALVGPTGSGVIHENYERLSYTGAIRVDYVVGTNGDDDVNMFVAGDVRTYGGDDEIAVFGGGALYGGSGNDRISGSGALMNGGSGDDFMLGGSTANTMFGGSDNDQMRGGLSGDIMRGNSGDDVIVGNQGADTLDGQDGDDIVWGGSGADIMFGGNGNDQLSGDGGDDVLFGQAGADVIDAGAGDDRIRSNAGADTIVFKSGNGIDRVLDFEDGQDRIDVQSYFFGDFADVAGQLVQQGTNVRLIDGSDILIISNALLADFSGADFIF